MLFFSGRNVTKRQQDRQDDCGFSMYKWYFFPDVSSQRHKQLPHYCCLVL